MYKEYKQSKKIFESSSTSILLSKDTADNFVAIKQLKSHESDQLALFKLEYEICKSLNLAGIPKVYNFEYINDSQSIIMEYFDGSALNNYIAKNKIGLEDFLNIAIKSTEIIGQIHKNNIIHKDINPSNILWNDKTKNLKIIDFGISSRLPHEVQAAINPSKLEGSLPYISPEQTGRMNRNIDYRTDYYSLGITLYELLTGRKPFESNDLLEILHFHIAKTPRTVLEVDPTVPTTISKIIMKLISKNAEDRYQSSYGIKYDFQKCFDSLNTYGRIEDFEIAQKDISERFEIPQKLYGRENELKKLLDGFDLVTQGELSQMILVSGFSGIGKSALVHEIYKPVLVERGYFISGKFDQLTRNIPYLPFIQAFQELIQHILTESEENLGLFKKRISKVLWDVGQVIVNLIPQIELLIGKPPKLPELEGDRAQNRFNLAFQNFVQALATKEHPLVIFIDDLQWADVPTLKMLEMLMTNEDIKHIYFICAYRDNEVNSEHPFMLTLKEIKKNDKELLDSIKLTDLTNQNVSDLICDTLKCDTLKAEELTKICIHKTQGNPFFFNQFLISLYEDNLIEFNNESGTWKWNIEEINKKGITENVVELMAQKIRKLSGSAQNVLKMAACCGNKFDLNTLSTICEKAEIETASNLWEALNQGLILPVNNNYKLLTEEDSKKLEISYSFLHDRVQQAAYSLINESDKKQVHLKIGRLLLKNISEDKLDKEIFEIAKPS